VSGPGFTISLPDGRLLGFAEYGDPSGHPVLTFHGWPSSRVQGERYDEVARRMGLRVIAPDRPGIGLSDRQPGRRLLDWPADVACLADRLGIERYGLLGVSGGAAYALACAALLPARATRVAVVSGYGPLDGQLDGPGLARRRHLLHMLGLRAPALFRATLWVVAQQVRRDAPAFLRWSASHLPECDRAIVSEPAYRSIAARDLQEALRQGPSGAVDDALLLLGSWDFNLRAIDIPVNLWHGELDTIAAVNTGRHVAGELPQCSALFLAHEAHYLIIPRAEEILSSLVATR
jgi:pimeloyl-ACP methyl ester carboxylesterase